MIGPSQPRTRLAWVLGAAVLLAMGTVLLVIRSEHGPDDGRLPALLSRASPQDPTGHAGPPAIPTAARAVLPMDGTTLPPVAANADEFGSEAGYFAGVPRAWTAPFTLRGRVVTQDGAPFVGARVLYNPDAMTREIVFRATGRRARDLPATRTDEEGRFTFRSLRGRPTSALPAFGRDQETVYVFVIDERCTELNENFDAPDFREADIGTLVVSPGSVLRGRVVSVEGHPLSGILVSSNVTSSLSGDVAESVTDAAGFYEFRGVEPGAGDVRLNATGWLFAKVDVPCGTPGGILVAPDLVADAGLAITGLVRDETGQPVPGAVVRVFEHDEKRTDGERWRDVWKSWTSEDAQGGVRAGGDGRFVLAGLRNGAHFVLAGASGFEPTAVQGAWPAGPPVEIILPSQNTAAVARAIRLEVADGDGLPVVGAHVFSSTSERGLDFTWDKPLEVQRDPDTTGRFMIELDGATECGATITAPGFASVQMSFTERDISATGGPRVVLMPERRLAGVVSDDAGVAIPFAWITLRPAGDGDAHRVSTREVGDESGHFVFGGLGPGLWNVEAFAEDSVTEDGLQVTLAESEVDHDLTITLRRPCTIEGWLRTANGVCPPEVEGESINVSLADDEDFSDWVGARADGSFRYSAARPGCYVLEGPLGARAKVEVGRSGIKDIVLVVSSPPIVSGRVLDGDRAVVGARILCTAAVPDRAPSGEPFFPSESLGRLPLTDEHGSFTLPMEEGGAFEIRALTAAGGSSDVQTVQLVPGKETRVELHLGTRRAAGVVIDRATHAPVPGVRIGLRGRVAAATGSDGRFVVAEIPDGADELLVRAPGGLVPDHVPLSDLSVAAASALTVELRAVSRLGVVLFGPNGLPTQGYVVLWRADTASMPDGSTVQLRGLTGSRECFCELAPGRYKLALQITGSAGWSQDPEEWEARRPDALVVDLAPGETREIVLHADAER